MSGNGHQSYPGERRKASICMFVYNNCVTDARVLKEAATLAEAGHRVQIVAVLDKLTEPIEERGGFRIVRIDRDPPHYKILRGSRRVRRAVRLARARTARRLGGIGRKRVVRVARKPAPLIAVTAGLPGRVYRYSRWRVLLHLPPARHLYYRRRARRGVGWLTRYRYRKRISEHRARRLGARDAGLSRPPWAATERQPEPPPEVRRTTIRSTLIELAKWCDRKVSRLLWRVVMVFHKPLMFLDYYWRAYALVRRQQFDVFHAHDLNTLPVAAVLARRSKAQLVYDSHELYPEMSTMRRVERWSWRRIERRLIRKPDAVITVCDSIGEEFNRRYGIVQPMTLLNCPNAVDPVSMSASDLLREKVGLVGSPERIVLYQGGLVPNRGLDNLIEASRYLTDAVVVMMGWGRIEDELREQIAREQLADRVILTGPVSREELLAYTAGADVGVIPYQAIGLNNYYTTPNKLFEYMVAGLPIVGSRFPELCRFLEGLEIGRTCDPDDPYDIAFALNAVLTDDELRERMSENALAAAERFVWEVESRKLVDLYDGIEPRLIRPRPPRGDGSDRLDELTASVEAVGAAKH